MKRCYKSSVRQVFYCSALIHALCLSIPVLPAMQAGTVTPSVTQEAHRAELTPALRKNVMQVCFEIVVRRPEKDNLTYERELPWDLVPFNIRNDRFVSIGTAFAVSRTELVTAHHVLDLLRNSLSYKQYFIRDAQQQVYELDQIVASDERKDVVRFTVKGRSFDRWLDLRPGFELNEPVFTVGNAIGEGVILRQGEVIGTVPEPLDGAWSLLKSSADINPGNSGGPLVDTAGRVIGVVLSRKDNICYSLPVAELQTIKPNTAVFFNKISFGFALFPEKSKAQNRSFEVPLPLSYQELKRQVADECSKFYLRGMGDLFANNQEELFPAGDTSQEVITDLPTSSNPEVIFKDNSSRIWNYSALDYKYSDLGKNGGLQSSVGADVVFVRIQKPDDVTLADLHSNPRLAMDLVLKGIDVPRVIGGQSIRITSFGDPIRREARSDRFGRTWQLAIWHVPDSDVVVIVYSTLVPSGLVMVAKFTDSPSLGEWIYDMGKILDFAYVPYIGKLKDWSEFLRLREALPETFKGMKFAYTEGRSIELEAPSIALSVDQRALEITDDASLGLYFGFTRRGEESAWDLRRMVLAESHGANYFVFIRYLKPLPSMSENYQKGWKEIAHQRHPYTQKAFEDEGTTRIAAVHPTFLGAGQSAEANPTLCTVHLSRSGKVGERELRERLKRLLTGIKPVEGTRPIAQIPVVKQVQLEIATAPKVP